ncbi:TMEM14 family protein [Tumidithrix helvetica PCC 7403]|uniref:TMEM14 family protein n=1 Tax=Tumidithrix helvetica TaxID=3457545 RepID=UPI003C9A8A8A
MSVSIVATAAYGVLAIAGGIFGYVKSQSKVSMISGSISGVGLLVAAVLQWQGQGWAKFLGLAISALLVLVFAVRLVKTRKFMPAGVMIVAGLAAIAAMLVPT